MSGSAESFRLIVFDTIDDPDPVRDLICRVTGLHPTDANQWIAHMPGVGQRPLDREQIRELLDGLYDLQIAAEARGPEAIPSLHPVRGAHDVACLPQGFRVRGLRREPIHWVPWDKIELLDAGYVEREDEMRTVGAPTWVTAMRNAVNTMIGRPRQVLGRRPRSLRIPREPLRALILIRRDPRVAFRLDEDALNYSYLGERLRPTAAENFPLLLADLCERSGEAFITASTRALLATNVAADNPPAFPSTQALIDDALLRLLWTWYKRDRDDDLLRRRGQG